MLECARLGNGTVPDRPGLGLKNLFGGLLMSLWSRILVCGLAMTLAVGMSLGSADAASKKKRKEAKKEAVKEVRHERASSSKAVIAGGNMGAKPGYFISDTASTLHKGQVMGALHLTFDTWGNVIQIPVGVSFGITDKLMLNANTSFYSSGGYTITTLYSSSTGPGTSGLYNVNFGGKYGFGRVAKGLDIAAGLDISIGPISNTLGASQFGFDPYGVATWTLPDGLQFNGKLGLYVTSYSVTIPNPAFIILGPPNPPTLTNSVGVSYFQLDLGAAYPFDKNLTGIAELATNGVITTGGLGGGTPLIVGIRTGDAVQFQAFGGLDLGGITGLFVGGGLVLVSK